VRYAVLNARDEGFLAAAGLPRERLHLLPNAVHVPGEPPAASGTRPLPQVDSLYLYPTRGIRRKNIGEVALIAACAPAGAAVATTLGPENPVWQPVHDRWRDFAAGLGLPLHLAAAGDGVGFAELVARSHALLTTSIAEGFGLAFLEPWGFGKGLIGRDLPEITRDFKQEGLALDDLYRRLDVPLDSFDLPAFRERAATALHSYFAAYGRQAPRATSGMPSMTGRATGASTSERSTRRRRNKPSPAPSGTPGCGRSSPDGYSDRPKPRRSSTTAVSSASATPCRRMASGSQASSTTSPDQAPAAWTGWTRAACSTSFSNPPASACSGADATRHPTLNNPAELARLIRSLSSAMRPEGSDLKARLDPQQGVRAVVFDVYGTLFVSSSGDIGLARAQDREEPARDALARCGVAALRGDLRVVDVFHQAVEDAQQRRRAEGVEHPEVEIPRRVAQHPSRARRRGRDRPGMPGEDRLACLAATYECLVNPVWPMPGMAGVLGTLRERGLLLGIVSNAQFFTPLLFEAFLERDLNALGFDAEACVFSYKVREAKPSPRLFQDLVSSLRKHGIEPHETIYIGNDMRNDIAPARATGLKTALFAGDKRSLRLRTGDPAMAQVIPNVVLTDLRQLPAALGLE
jgi:putative hydrolase of the HAD superfamily